MTVNGWKTLASSETHHQLRQICMSWKPDVLVASGIWISPHWRVLAQIRREFDIPISFDMHGALEELTEYKMAFGSRWASNLLFEVCRRSEGALFRRCADHIEVVSNNMELYVRATYPTFRGPITVIPCGIDAPIDDASYERNRHTWRSRLGLDASRPAAAYAGNTARWQRIADIVRFARARPNIQVYLFLEASVPVEAGCGDGFSGITRLRLGNRQPPRGTRARPGGCASTHDSRHGGNMRDASSSWLGYKVSESA